jgi:hypothetical protein
VEPVTILFDSTLVQPNTAELRTAVASATAAANQATKSRLVSPQAEEIDAVLTTVLATPEGRHTWDGLGGGPATAPTSVVCLVWCPDGVGQKHVRVVGLRARTKTGLKRPLGAAEKLPPLGQVYPDRVVRRKRAGQLDLCILCQCGRLGTPTEIGWGSDGCNACRRDGAAGLITAGPHDWNQYFGFSPERQFLLGHTSRYVAGPPYYLDYDFRCWDLTQPGSEPRHLHTHGPGCPALSPNGSLLAQVDEHNRLHLWDLGTLEERLVVPIDQAGSHILAFAPDGRTLVLLGQGDQLSLWDARTGQFLRRFAGLPATHYSFERQLVFSPDGRFLSWNSSEAFALWEVNSARLVVQAAIPGYQSASNRVLFTPDSRAVVTTGGAEGNKHARTLVKVWDSTTGACTATLDAGQHILAMGIAPDGKTVTLWTRPNEHEIQVWDLSSQSRQTLNCPATQGTTIITQHFRYEPGTHLAAVALGHDQFLVFDYAAAQEVALLTWPCHGLRTWDLSPGGDELWILTRSDRDCRLMKWAWPQPVASAAAPATPRKPSHRREGR